MGSGQMMPELGSRISLISKADIRYEGRLFTVDPQECTIALANVRSFGTEDRETPYPIMPQPTVYDYILFRGSDIKDIRVVNNVTIPNDPAIMQMQMNQQPGFSPQQMQQGPLGGQFGPFANLQGPPPMGNIPPQQQQNQAQPPNQQNQGQSSQQAQPSQTQSSPQQQPLSQQDSRSATPNQSRKSPTSDMGVQTSQRSGENQGANKDKMQRNINNQRSNNNNNNHHHQQQQQQRDRRDDGRIHDGYRNQEGYRNQRMPPPQHHQQQQQQQRGGYNNKSRGGSGRMPMMRGPPHQNGTFFQNYRQNNNPQANRPNKPPNKNQNTLKFENEFDFEKANSKFEELRSEFSKLKVGSEENKNPEPQVNGGIVEKKDDSGNETSADHDHPEGDDYDGYDKQKSFFDNISCEANERSKGKTQRTDWRQERKINSETFGLTMNRRGGMRGRGGYYRNQYGRPMNNYRGGGGGQQYRNNNNNNNRNRTNPQQQGVPPRINNQGQSATTAVAAADK